MRIPCPYCGERDRQEFTVRGELPQTARPEGLDASAETMFEHVYSRKNIAGVHRELWYHGAGCHSWLVLQRDTRTHAATDVSAARETLKRGAVP